MANSGGNWITYKGRRIFIGKGKGSSYKTDSDGFHSKKEVEHKKRKIENDIKRNAYANKSEYEQLKKDYDDLDNLSKKINESGNNENKKDFERGSKEHYDALVKSGMKKEDAQAIVDIEKGNLKLKKDNYGSYYEKTSNKESKNIIDEVNKEKADYAKKKAEEYKNTKDPMFQDVKEQRAKEYEKQAKEYEEYYKKEGLGEPSNYQNGDKIVFDNGYYNTVKGTVLREATEQEKKYVINNNLKGYMVRDVNGFEYVVPDTRIIKQSSNPDWVKNAFKQYKKNHPESKFTIQDFMKNYK